MQKCKVKLVSFDCGGTLYYEVEKDYVIFHKTLSELGHRLEISDVKKALDDARCWWECEKVKANKIWNETTWIGLLRQMALNLSLPNPDLIAYHLRDNWISKAEFRAYEDAEPTLRELKRRRIQTIAISNVSSRRNLATYLKGANLLNYFSLLVASGDVGHEKPDSEIFRIASKLSKVHAKAMLHVGDKYEEDYLGAQSAGLKAILIDRNNSYEGVSCIKISRLTELIDYL